MTKKNKLKVALCMIAKDKETIIERALESTNSVFDVYCLADTGSSDRTVDIFRSWCYKNKKECVVHEGKLGIDYKFITLKGEKVLGDFASARNKSFDLARSVKADFAYWIDTDDILVNGHLIPQLASKMGVQRIAAALMIYDYGQTAEGIKLVTQKRERLINLHLNGKWKDRVHETYQFLEPAKIVDIPDIKVVHLRSAGEAEQHGLADPQNRRNCLIMTSQLEEEGLQSISDQMLRNLAFDHFEYNEWFKCIEYYQLLLSRDSVRHPELLLDIHMHLAKAYRGLDNSTEAIKHTFEATKIAPTLADPYLLLAELFASIGNWDDAEYYADKVLDLGMPQTASPVNELNYSVIPLRMKIQSRLAQGDLSTAVKLYDELLRMMPGNSDFISEKRKVEKEIATQRAINGFKAIKQYLILENRFDWNNRLQDAVPPSLLTNNVVRELIKEMKHDYKKATNKTQLDGSKNIIFYAGGHYEPWDGNSDKKKGIGGSEGMCLQMAKELAKLGNKVFVYNECGESDGKVIEGVTYLDWRKWSTTLNCDILVSLRHPEVFSMLPLIKAKKAYLWLHDTFYGDQNIVNFYAPHKTIVLSDFHKEVIQRNHGVDDNKAFWVTRNAINAAAVEKSDKLKLLRNPYKVIYASSYDRGLDNALKAWKKVKEAVPEAEFHIYYGWNTYDAMMNQRQGTPYGNHMMKQKEELLKLMDQPGVFEHGRVSQEELYKQFATASIWFYPTQFEEISCINAMTAQAMGAVPVCTPLAALQETVNSKYGFKAELNKCSDTLIYLLQNQKELEKRREPMMRWARAKFNMTNLAKEWDEFFNND